MRYNEVSVNFVTVCKCLVVDKLQHVDFVSWESLCMLMQTPKWFSGNEMKLSTCIIAYKGSNIYTIVSAWLKCKYRSYRVKRSDEYALVASGYKLALKNKKRLYVDYN